MVFVKQYILSLLSWTLMCYIKTYTNQLQTVFLTSGYWIVCLLPSCCLWPVCPLRPLTPVSNMGFSFALLPLTGYFSLLVRALDWKPSNWLSFLITTSPSGTNNHVCHISMSLQFPLFSPFLALTLNFSKLSSIHLHSSMLRSTVWQLWRNATPDGIQTGGYGSPTGGCWWSCGDNGTSQAYWWHRGSSYLHKEQQEEG